MAYPSSSAAATAAATSTGATATPIATPIATPPTTTTTARSDRCALLLCDLQQDALNAIPEERRAPFLELLQLAVEAARAAGWTLVFSGLRFQSGYEGLDPKHKLFGAFKRLNAKVGDKGAHWFMDGFDGAEIVSKFRDTSESSRDIVTWRSRHSPPPDLVRILEDNGIGKVAVAGLKASGGVQRVCQYLMDEGFQTYALKDCIEDDKPERLSSVLEHLLPLYSEVIRLEDLLLDLGLDELAAETRRRIAARFEKRPADTADTEAAVKLCSDCKRGGHGQLFCKFLLRRPTWQSWPTELWFQDEYWKEFYCPESRRIVDLADEPQFSRVAMYLKGRAFLEDKTKVVELAGGHMPETYRIEQGAWKGPAPPADGDEEVLAACWFLKQADRNWGTSIFCFRTPSECLKHAEKDSRYVVQQHIRDPALSEDGRKCHIKFYLLVVAAANGDSWRIFCYKDGYACLAPTRWQSDDTTIDTQVTIVRSCRLSQLKDYPAWPAGGYEKCKQAAFDVVSAAVKSGKLEGREGQSQFEIFSADFMLDTHGKAWLLEFNFDPVLREGERHTTTDDTSMVQSALDIVFPEPASGGPGLWDLAGEINMNKQ